MQTFIQVIDQILRAFTCWPKIKITFGIPWFKPFTADILILWAGLENHILAPGKLSQQAGGEFTPTGDIANKN